MKSEQKERESMRRKLRKSMSWLLTVSMIFSLVFGAIPTASAAPDDSVWDNYYTSIRVYLDESVWEDFQALGGGIDDSIRLYSEDLKSWLPGNHDEHGYYKIVYGGKTTGRFESGNAQQIIANELTGLALIVDQASGSSKEIYVPIEGNNKYEIGI